MSTIGDTLPLTLQRPEPIAEQLAAAILPMIEDAIRQDAGVIGEFVELPADAGGIVWTEGEYRREGYTQLVQKSSDE